MNCSNRHPLILMQHVDLAASADLQHPQKNVAVNCDEGIVPGTRLHSEQVLDDEEEPAVRADVLGQHGQREEVPHAVARLTQHRGQSRVRCSIHLRLQRDGPDSVSEAQTAFQVCAGNRVRCSHLLMEQLLDLGREQVCRHPSQTCDHVGGNGRPDVSMQAPGGPQAFSCRTGQSLHCDSVEFGEVVQPADVHFGLHGAAHMHRHMCRHTQQQSPTAATR